MLLGITFGFPSLVAILITMACAQLEKLKSTMFHIRQEHNSAHDGQEQEQVYKIAKCKLQAKLNACIQHHQQIIA
jgi:hypothetical protein